MKAIDVGKEFHHRLANRDELQGDGKYTAVQFRKLYLSKLDNSSAWEKQDVQIILDFANVDRLGPSFANEAFGYFTRYAKPDQIMRVIEFRNLTDVQKSIIIQELMSASTGEVHG